MPTKLTPYLQRTLPAGTDFLQDADADGHIVPYHPLLQIYFQNGSGGEILARFASVRDSNFGPYPTWDLPVVAGFWGPSPLFGADRFRGADGNLAFTLSEVSGVRVGALILYVRLEND